MPETLYKSQLDCTIVMDLRLSRHAKRMGSVVKKFKSAILGEREGGGGEIALKVSKSKV